MNIRPEDILALPVSERIQLVADIWDTISEAPDQPELSPALLAMLRKRLAEHKANPDDTLSWDEVVENIRYKITK